MISAVEEKRYRAENDAYIISQYLEIMQDKERVKLASEYAEKEVAKIEDTFINADIVDDFSVKVTYEQIQKKNYSLSAGQYFEVKIEYVELTPKEFEEKMAGFKDNLSRYFEEGKILEKEIEARLEELKYDI